jgi:hypothetical protein
MIDHVTRGCHTLDVNGAGPGSARATIHLAAGGVLHMQNNDVMPHTLVLAHGPAATLVSPAMGHMGAKSTVSFPTAGTYSLTTKAGEDYRRAARVRRSGRRRRSAPDTAPTVGGRISCESRPSLCAGSLSAAGLADGSRPRRDFSEGAGCSSLACGVIAADAI